MEADHTYLGNCHCGRFRFEINVPGLGGLTVCDCRLCAKKGYLWLPLDRQAFRVTRDDDRMRDFSASSVRDKFCGHCGTGITGEHVSGPMAGRLAVNLRAVQGLNPFELEKSAIKQSAQESTPELPTPRPDAHQTASCYCGKVKAELLIPLPGLEVKEDNCSFCVRTAFIGVYPNRDQVRISGRESTFEYLHGRGYNGTAHCETCGVNVFSNIYGPDPGIFDKLPPERREMALKMYHKNMALQPLNVRTFEGLDLGTLKVERDDCGTEGYKLDS
ncbi:hypothetical protein NLU13_5540 [Sarocladium strictum]|uniref:CENP-V/GFA domain-containing protein n=1 Tax=Sarocladium strictum TaxID=5046 RepID=A0AA39L7R0_SARSR|nr:hypothetical protein NLU13_5540 [Sarocladium strictum]